MALSIGLVTLNARYIHSSLSLRYLRNAARQAGYEDVWIEEFVINQPIWKIAAELNKRQPDILGVSVYIWNRKESFELIERLQKQMPSLKIVVGGPEVSFEKELPQDYYVISGEGENKWLEFIDLMAKNETPSEEVLTRWNTYGIDLPELIPPYLPEDFPLLIKRIAYIETSRGCPYLCSFCLSALDKKVRYFDDSIIHKQIEGLATAGARRIKFVDRTFNLKPARMIELMQWLSQFKEVSFHFEVVADILTDDLLDYLETVPEGMFQFEIGIQTLSPDVQETIKRRQDTDKLFNTIRRLVEQDKIHFHCDLIFGLPGETLEKIKYSFEQVLSLQPHELQLGFLKFLPGAPINDQIEKNNYLYQSTPPYELISHKDLSAENVIYLKKFTEVFDLFYNSKRFKFTLDFLFRKYDGMEIFDRLLNHMEDRELLFRPHSLEEQYRIFMETFDLKNDPTGFDLLRLDYLYAQKVYHMPPFLAQRNSTSQKVKFKTWTKDRKTPIIPFEHEIQVNGPGLRIEPATETRYYAIAHPEDQKGYFQKPVIHPVLQ
jgi:radical SAM superfamily enzyme YgiQ (UPF0313 family)